jgi:hypothetical protein
MNIPTPFHHEISKYSQSNLANISSTKQWKSIPNLIKIGYANFVATNVKKYKTKTKNIYLDYRLCRGLGMFLKQLQTFQVSRNYREIPAFLFAFTHHAWSDFLPAFLNLTCRGYFLWAKYVFSHFFSLIAQCSNVRCILFANASIPRSLEKSWKCMSQSHIKKIQKAGRLLSLRSAIFCRLWRRDANISYFYSMNA